MWISRRTDYATRALVALAREDGERPVKIQDLAERTDTPVSILEQVLPQLRSAGIDTGGPAPFSARDGKAFASQLDRFLARHGKP